MTFILNNITNWLTDSQSSESSTVETDARTSEQCDEWVTTTASTSGYTSVKRIEAHRTDCCDLETTEDAVDDLPGISKVVTSAIEWGGYLLTYGKETGRHVTRAAMTQIKSAFEENASPEELPVEKTPTDTTPLAPWIGYSDEQIMKVQILSITEDKRNFLRGPPVGVQFHFDYAQSYPIASIMLLEDPNLKAMRFELVPKQIKEETFWRNYFYRVALIKQSAQLAKHKAQAHEPIHKTTTCAENTTCADTDLVFVPNTFTACEEDASYSGEVAAQHKSSNIDLQDFELVEVADCDGSFPIDDVNK